MLPNKILKILQNTAHFSNYLFVQDELSLRTSIQATCCNRLNAQANTDIQLCILG